MKKLTKDQFNALGTEKQVKYINELSNLYSNRDFVKYGIDDEYPLDIDSDTEIENIYDYLLDLDKEFTDLHNVCFVESFSDLLDEYIKCAGIKKSYLHEKLDITNATFIRKTNTMTFTQTELQTLREVLNLTNDEFLRMF